MTNISDAGATPANVAGHATTSGALERNDFALIGLFGKDGALSALVRLPNGRIQTVATGTKIPQGQVVAIDAEGLMLQKNGRTERISMPGG